MVDKKCQELRNRLFHVTCAVCMKLALEIHASNNTDMLQIVCICMLLITNFFFAQLPSYCLFVIILSMPISPEIHIIIFCNIWPNQHMCHIPIFSLQLCGTHCKAPLGFKELCNTVSSTAIRVLCKVLGEGSQRYLQKLLDAF